MARKTPSLQDVLDEYLATRQHTAHNTQLNDRSVLGAFVRHIGDLQVGHLTSRHVEDFFLGPNGLIHRNNEASYNKVLQRVDGFLNFCRSRNYTRTELLGNVRKRRTVQRERLLLGPALLLALLEATPDPRDRAMLAVAQNLGLRASELTAIKVRDVDLDAGFIHVIISKSAIEDRMPISSDLDKELRRWLTTYAQQVADAFSADAYLFPARYPPRLRSVTSTEHPVRPQPGGLRPDRPVSKPAVIVQRALRRIGLDIEAGEGFHTLRRSAGRAFFDSLAAKGHDEALRMTSSFLHHASSQTTERYLGLRHERLQRDLALRGQPFLTAMVETNNVTPMPVVRRSG